MAYRDSGRYRDTNSPAVPLPGILLIIVLAVIAYYLIDSCFNIPYLVGYEVYPDAHSEEFHPAVGPDSYATK